MDLEELEKYYQNQMQLSAFQLIGLPMAPKLLPWKNQKPFTISEGFLKNYMMFSIQHMVVQNWLEFRRNY
jgi:hypothetical protein